MTDVVDTIPCDGDPNDTLSVERVGDGWIAVAVTQDGEECFVNLTPTSAFRAATAILVGSNAPPFPESTKATKAPATLHGADAEDERQGWNIDALTAAIEYGKLATFSYEKESGPGGLIEQRRLIPEKLDTTNAGKLVVLGEDQDRDETRVFRLDRIVGFVNVQA